LIFFIATNIHSKHSGTKYDLIQSLRWSHGRLNVKRTHVLPVFF